MFKARKVFAVVFAAGMVLGVGGSTPAANAEVKPLVCLGCQEGCTGGQNCYAYEKCEKGSCKPTVQQVNCKSDASIE